MDPDADFAASLAGLRTGDQHAAKDFCRRYGPTIRGVARRALDRTRMRNQYDSTDFLQEVWVRLLTLPADHPALASSDALLGFLTRAVRGKVTDAARHHRAEVDHTAPADDPVGSDDDGPHSPAPSPVESAIAGDIWDRLLDQLPPVHRPLARMLRDGFTHEVIAARTGTSIRTVVRMVTRLREVYREVDAALRNGRSAAPAGRR